MMFRHTLFPLVAVSLIAACGDQDSDADPREVAQVDGKSDRVTDPKNSANDADALLREALNVHGVTPLDPGDVRPMSDPRVVLGQKLFFDPALSGNQDIACATCHHPEFGTSDALSLPVGVGGQGLGPTRELGEEHEFIPRNSPEIFNRGATAWTTMFWDSRVQDGGGSFYSPAGDDLPDGLDSVLAVQAMFPVTSPEEMRGAPGDGPVADAADLPEVWRLLTERILGFEEYQGLFAKAYPEVAQDELGFEHIANAIADYEVAAFTMLDAPFDRYLAGDERALDGAQKRGALLFFGDANCASCHNGPLLTDQQTHVIAVPQFGPGKGEDAPLDTGRMLETGDDADKYAFRTPPLRNVELTGPYMHAGSYTTLRQTIEHHLDPGATVYEFDTGHLDPRVAATMVTDQEFIDDCMSRVSPLLAPERPLSDAEVDDLVAFLKSLTDPSAHDMSDVVPESVPSGLPVP